MNFSGIPDSEREGIIIIHQELALIPLLSIAENISLGHEMLEITGWNVWHRADRQASDQGAGIAYGGYV